MLTVMRGVVRNALSISKRHNGYLGRKVQEGLRVQLDAQECGVRR
jgi:hypothetical protein